MPKSAEAFRTISEVGEILDTPAHVLRFWESQFAQIKPMKRAGGRRYYRPQDVALLSGIKKLLHEDGVTIRGVKKILKEQGVKHVAALADTGASPVLATSAPQPTPQPSTESPTAPAPPQGEKSPPPSPEPVPSAAKQAPTPRMAPRPRGPQDEQQPFLPFGLDDEQPAAAEAPMDVDVPTAPLERVGTVHAFPSSRMESPSDTIANRVRSAAPALADRNRDKLRAVHDRLVALRDRRRAKLDAPKG
ncbi:MerR family transcriptional regulator [Defluviimonas sp. WL0002]|uniref:MerR family transcriptional regulator n=1 Tax=Albidovulum marisflavi TaxID=2984159 RepID=A0ABT2ZBW0_9RHOB|nr:MerR family transcriptional regulator [Defluviimonas sp. WL0002]MCV2868634.1 MerR family transcriptional regulator [Defluviimonas sp. WL0002]